MNTAIKSAGETTVLNRRIRGCQNDAEFMRLMDNNRGGAENNRINNKWAKFFVNDLMDINSSSEETAAKCGVSVRTLQTWKNKAPVKRENYVGIGCCFGLGVEATSRLMKRFGGYSELNKNCQQDIIYIRLLEISAGKYTQMADRNAFSMLSQYEEERDNRRLGKKLNLGDERFIGLLGNTNDENIWKAALKLDEKIRACGFGSNDVFYKKSGFRSGQIKTMTRFKKGIVPPRNFLIAVSLYLGLPMKSINKVLASVYMEPLCSKNPYEAALMFILNDLYNKHPEFASVRRTESGENEKIQAVLPDGTLFKYVYRRMNTEPLRKYLINSEIDIDKCMCC